MDNSRLKKACAKAFSVTAACFIMSIVLVSSVYALFGWRIEPSMIVAMWILFAVICGASPQGEGNAKWQVLRRAMDALDSKPGSSVLIGDTKYDVFGAKRCGIFRWC